MQMSAALAATLYAAVLFSGTVAHLIESRLVPENPNVLSESLSTKRLPLDGPERRHRHTNVFWDKALSVELALEARQLLLRRIA